MPEQLYKSFSVTGIENKTVLDSGLSSTTAEPKKLVSVLLKVSGHIDNEIVGFLERESKLEIPDYLVITDEASGTDMFRSTNRKIEIPIDKEIPVGQTWKIGLKCGATLKVLKGSYRYEIGG
ncbi:unnamed protein product [marine sediment metagenome]|uniref:Uncharacterized protein n=1 Tax=marine sediment metagenome TaxID=412755 RepID=X1JJT5_9ZZZZ